MNILYVEDEKHLALSVAQVLEKNNYNVELAYDGEQGLDYSLSGQYDIIILDLMLPKMDGINVLQEIRRAKIETPVILLTAKGETKDKVNGLDGGADDYLAKPFQMEELLARLRALGRRKGQLAADNMLSCGDIELNYNTLKLYGNVETFQLTLKESQILELLILNKGQAISTASIIEKVWGWDTDTEDSHVHVQIAFLRKKLALLSTSVIIKTIYGVGYMLTLSEETVDCV
ncbi:MAG TPA: response regulator transcription factor [Clostridiaceae bacterium]|nr:response regulator transcription factor [Clostridiaceae bacterium]